VTVYELLRFITSVYVLFAPFVVDAIT